MMESFATPYPCIFHDGDQEVDKGHIGVHSVLTFKRFQAQVAAKTGHPAGSLSAVLVCTRTTGDTTKKQKLPINENTNFNIILNQHNPSRERDAHFLVSLKKSKKERKTGGAGAKKRAAETETADEEDASSARDEVEPAFNEERPPASALLSPEASPILKGGSGSPGGSLRSPQPMSSPVSVLPPIASNNSQRSTSELGVVGKMGIGGAGVGGGGKGEKGAPLVGGKRDLADMNSSVVGPSASQKSSWQGTTVGSQRHQKGGGDGELGSLELGGRSAWGADRVGGVKNPEPMMVTDEEDSLEVRGRGERPSVQQGLVGSSGSMMDAAGSEQETTTRVVDVAAMKLSDPVDVKGLQGPAAMAGVQMQRAPSSSQVQLQSSAAAITGETAVVSGVGVSGNVAVMARLAAARAAAGVVTSGGVMGKGSGVGVGMTAHPMQQQQQQQQQQHQPTKLAFGTVGFDVFRAPLQPHVQQDFSGALNEFRPNTVVSSNGLMAFERSQAMVKLQQQQQQQDHSMQMIMMSSGMQGGGALKENGQQVKGCRFCNFCKERKMVPSFHGCVEDQVVQGFRGPSPAGPIRRPVTRRVEAVA